MMSFRPAFRSALLFLWIAFGFTSVATAARRQPIYQAADDYREAVREFERQVLRTRGVTSSVKRLVDDLEDSTSDLKSAALDPARFDRLSGRMVATDALHARVELTFFGDPLCPPAAEIQQAWIPVYERYGELVNQMLYLQQIRAAKRGSRVPVVNHGDLRQIEPYPASGQDRFGGSILKPSRQVILTPDQLRSLDGSSLPRQ